MKNFNRKSAAFWLACGLFFVSFGQACGQPFSALSTSIDQNLSIPTSPDGTPATVTVSPTPAPAATVAQAFTTVANRYDNLASASVTSVGSAITITLVPNGTWPTATFTPTLRSGSGTFNPATVSVTAGSSTPATVQYTPTTVGEHSIQFSNNAGLNNPYYAPLNVFSASDGSAQTLAMNLGRSYSDLHVFQRDTFSGDAAGFSLGAHGWGEVWMDVSAIGGATTALWARPYDALSSGASSTVGTGNALSSAPAQIYGAVSASGTLRLLLPAQDAVAYWDIATDKAMTHPVRVAQRISVADKIGAMTRSQKAGWGRGYANYGPTATGVSFVRTSIAEMADYRYPPSSDLQWSRQDGVNGDPNGSTPYGESTTAAAMEAGRLFSSLRGVNLGIVADCSDGGGTDEFIAHDGSSGFTQLLAVSDNKIRYLTINMTGWDAVDANYPTETAAEDKIRFANFIAKTTAAIPSLAVIGGNVGATGIYGNDGSRALGYTRNQMMWRQLSAQNPMVVSLEDYHWAGFNGGHSTQASRVQYARQDVRYLLSRDSALTGGLQTSVTGPTLAATGTLQTGTGTIKIAYNLNGASSLHNYQIRAKADAISFVYSKDTASASDLASLFAVYPQGGYSGAGGALGTPLAINGVSFDGSYVYIKLTTTANTPVTVHYASDFNVSGGTGLVASNPGGEGLVTILGDDRDPLGVGIGQSMFAAVDIAISVAP